MHHDKLTETSLLIMEKVVKNELEEELPEDLRLVRVYCVIGEWGGRWGDGFIVVLFIGEAT